MLDNRIEVVKASLDLTEKYTITNKGRIGIGIGLQSSYSTELKQNAVKWVLV